MKVGPHELEAARRFLDGYREMTGDLTALLVEHEDGTAQVSAEGSDGRELLVVFDVLGFVVRSWARVDYPRTGERRVCDSTPHDHDKLLTSAVGWMREGLRNGV